MEGIYVGNEKTSNLKAKNNPEKQGTLRHGNLLPSLSKTKYFNNDTNKNSFAKHGSIATIDHILKADFESLKLKEENELASTKNKKNSI